MSHLFACVPGYIYAVVGPVLRSGWPCSHDSDRVCCRRHLFCCPCTRLSSRVKSSVARFRLGNERRPVWSSRLGAARSPNKGQRERVGHKDASRRGLEVVRGTGGKDQTRPHNRHTGANENHVVAQPGIPRRLKHPVRLHADSGAGRVGSLPRQQSRADGCRGWYTFLRRLSLCMQQQLTVITTSDWRSRWCAGRGR